MGVDPLHIVSGHHNAFAALSSLLYDGGEQALLLRGKRSKGLIEQYKIPIV